MSATEQKPRGDLAALRIQREEEDKPRRAVSGTAIASILGVSVLVIAALLVYERWIAPRRLPPVETTVVHATINPGNQPLLTTTGYLITDRVAVVNPTIAGRVITLNADTGMEVHRGDILAVIQSDQLQAQLAEDEASRVDAKREYDRQAQLWKEGVTSRSNLDSAESTLKVAEARKRQVEVQLRDTVIRAPFDGTVVSKNTEVGEMVSPISYQQDASGSPLSVNGAVAGIADLKTLEVDADVNESNLGRLRVGQPAEVGVDAFPGRKWRGVLRKIIPTADRAKGIVKVRVSIINPVAGLLPDMSSTVAFLDAPRTEEQLHETAKIWIPETAVVSDPSGARVFVVTPRNSAKMRIVKIGATREGRVEVVSGLRDGDRVVTSDLESLTDGETVRLQEP